MSHLRFLDVEASFRGRTVSSQRQVAAGVCSTCLMADPGSRTVCSRCLWLGSQWYLPAVAPGDAFGLGLARPLAVGAGGGGAGRFRGSARSGLHRAAHVLVEVHVWLLGGVPRAAGGQAVPTSSVGDRDSRGW